MTSRRSTRGKDSPRDASAPSRMWPRCNHRIQWWLLGSALTALCFESSLASAQAQDKTPASAATDGDTSKGAPTNDTSGHATDKSTSATDATGSPPGAQGAKQPEVQEGEVVGKLELVEPPTEAAKPSAATQQAQTSGPAPQATDELAEPGYLPGYKRYFGLGMSPNVPTVPGLPGGFTPGYAAPVPAKNWTFSFTGSANISLQPTGTMRHNVQDGQSSFVLHTPPRVIEEYSSFTSSSSVPGNWVSLKFTYGTPRVAAIVSVDTWNPTDPTSYYQLGSQSYVNNAYLAFTPVPIGKLRLRINAGQLTANYGFLSKWNGGVYVNPMAAILKGIGETVIAEYDLTDKVTLTAEHGVMTTRDGTPPIGYVTEASNGYRRQFMAGAIIDHAHLGLATKGPYEVIAELHYIDAFYQDERGQSPTDNPQTPEIDESHIRDPRIRVFAGDFKVNHDSFGQLALGLSFIDAKYAYPLTGLMTYGGDGGWLTDRWFGVTTGGTGKLLVSALNYSTSIGKLINYPAPFSGNGPDLLINTGVHWTKTWTDFQPYDGRVRWKGTVDALYVFMRYVAVGTRVDHIVPNSYDSGETYNVLAPRLQFKTDWTSREALTLLYARWFYGPRSRNEGTGLRTPDRLDNNLFALNFNIWW